MYIEKIKTLCCDICKNIIADGIELEDAQSEEDEFGFHYCKQHLFVNLTFTNEQKIYATETGSTNLSGFAAWKMLR